MDSESTEDIAARLFVAADLGDQQIVALDDAQTHYLRNVLRLDVGDNLALFNGRDGEWRADLVVLGRSSGRLCCVRQLRPQEAEPDLWLLFAPVKRARIDFLVEKATELGVSRMIPVQTRRTVPARINLERLHAHAREAAEQSERLTVPTIEPLTPLFQALERFPASRRLVFCDETGDSRPIAAVLREGLMPDGAGAVLIGPEGGFAPDELDRLKSLPFVDSVGLGPRVLRADTAALAVLAVWQALAGDWVRRRVSSRTAS